VCGWVLVLVWVWGKTSPMQVRTNAVERQHACAWALLGVTLVLLLDQWQSVAVWHIHGAAWGECWGNGATEQERYGTDPVSSARMKTKLGRLDTRASAPHGAANRTTTTARTSQQVSVDMALNWAVRTPLELDRSGCDSN
jgi:hypothetical protein